MFTQIRAAVVTVIPGEESPLTRTYAPRQLSRGTSHSHTRSSNAHRIPRRRNRYIESVKELTWTQAAVVTPCWGSPLTSTYTPCHIKQGMSHSHTRSSNAHCRPQCRNNDSKSVKETHMDRGRCGQTMLGVIFHKDLRPVPH